MEWQMEWNWNFGMEYGRYQNGMEWKILRMEWKTIFHTSIPDFEHCINRKIWYGCRIVINNIVKEVSNFNIYAYYLSTNRGTLLMYIAQTAYVLHLAIQCNLLYWCYKVDRFILFYFYFEIDNLPSRIFFSSFVKKIRICYFIPILASFYLYF